MVEIKIAKTAGFCWGVKRAIDITLNAARGKSGPIYTFGPLIHNSQLIEILKNKNIHTLKSLKGIEKSEIIIRTHGITPKQRSEIKGAGHKTIDATCPLVAKAQGLIKKYSKKGYSIFIIGDDGHAEVEGLKGFVKTEVHIFAESGEIERLPLYPKVFVVAQTTSNREKYEEIIKALRIKYPVLEVGDTICEASIERQEEVRLLAKEVELMVVVGGKNSANTNRLAEIAREKGVETILIETEDELDLDKLTGLKMIGVTSGASTPKWLLERVINRLEKLSDTKKYPLPSLAESMRFFIKSNLYLAIGAAALTYANMRVMGIEPGVVLMAVPFFAVLSTYLIHELINATNLVISNPRKYYYHNKYRKLFMGISLAAVLAGGILSWTLGIWQLLFYSALVVFGATYGSNILKWKSLLPFVTLKDIPGSRNVFASLAWGIITVVVPYISAGEGKVFFLPLAFTLSVVYSRSLLFELKEIFEDQVVGKEVLPIVFGKEKASWVLYGVLLFMTIILITGFYWSSGEISLIAMLACIIYLFWFVFTGRDREWAHSTKFEFFLDGQFILFGFMIYFIDYF